MKAFVPAFIWAIVILFLTLTPGQFLPKVDYWAVFSLDKYVHFGIFAIQSVLLFLGAWKNHKLGSMTVKLHLFLIAVVFGIMIELLQTLIPHRSFDVNDMVANTVGCLLGLVFAIFLDQIKRAKA